MVSELQVKIADVLNLIIVDLKFFVFDLWHIIHFISGGIVMFLILSLGGKSKTKEKLIIFFGLLVLYELFEIAFIWSGSHFFRGETILNVFWDIFIGSLGGMIVFYFRKSLFH